MALVGDFRKLAHLIRSTGQLGSREWRTGLFRALAEEGRSLVVEAFEDSVDPYGTPWKPSRQRARPGPGWVIRGRGQILRDTGVLLSSIHSRATPRGFTLSTNVPYAAIHNFGGEVRVKPGVQAHEAGTGRFIRRTQASTRRREVQVEGRARSVRVSFRGASSWQMPRRMFIPPAENIGPRWGKALQDAIREAVEEAFP
jgi:phage gpG-like protein